MPSEYANDRHEETPTKEELAQSEYTRPHKRRLPTLPSGTWRPRADGPVLAVRDEYLLLTEGDRMRKITPRWEGTSLVLGCTTITADALGKIMRFVSYGERDEATE